MPASSQDLLSDANTNIYMNGISARFSAHFYEPNNTSKHYHDNLNIVYILEGGCVERRAHSTFERAAADILLLPADEIHETILTKWPTRYLQCVISSHLLF